MDELRFVSIGGIGDVTKNMYAYILGNEILIVDCGIGFADSSLPGVDLLIPDITFLKKELSEGKKIVGMCLSHGHEDHIGALPFILPDLPKFPIYGSNLTAALSNDKLSEFRVGSKVNIVNFTDTHELVSSNKQSFSSNNPLQLGSFTVTFIRMTHSIIDAANLFIKTPAGNFYHGSDFKFDFTPVDGKPSELSKIAQAGNEGVTCLFSDALGAEKPGHSRSEQNIKDSFEEAFRKTKGKVFVTTYSSNISRLNQAIEVAVSQGRKVCFMGRSLLKARDVGRTLHYMNLNKKFEIRPQEISRYKPEEVLILIAGSQAQESSALTRVSNNNDRDIRIEKGDSVIFSADSIPGNEENIYALIDLISRRGATVIYSDITDEFHVSGHGSSNDLKLLISLTRPKYLIPIGATYRQMAAYREIAKDMGYPEGNVFLPESGQEVLFTKNSARFGKKTQTATVFLDQMTGEEVDSFVVVDRARISKEGVIIIMTELVGSTGQLTGTPDILTKGFVYEKKDEFAKKLSDQLKKRFEGRAEPITSVGYYKKTIEKVAEEILYKEGRSPLVVPVIIEV